MKKDAERVIEIIKNKILIKSIDTLKVRLVTLAKQNIFIGFIIKSILSFFLIFLEDKKNVFGQS